MTARCRLPPILLGALTLPLGGCAFPAARPQSALETVGAAFVAARAMPLDSRPMPPDIDLRSVVGASSPDVLKALGLPRHCTYEFRNHLPGATCWSYTYGPKSAPPQIEDGYIVVTTGGPWLLLLEISDDRVVNATWLGQK